MNSKNPFHGEMMEAVSLEGVEQNGNHNGLATAPVEASDHDAVGTMKAAVESPDQGNILPLQIEQHEVEPSATWIQAAYHTITAVVGAGVLGLPHAFSFLGWGVGIAVLAAAGLSALFTARLLAVMHESNGVRHNRYRDLGTAIMGKAKSDLFIAPFQYSIMVGLAVTYTVTAGKSLQVIQELFTDGCEIAIDPEIDPDIKGITDCDVNLTQYIFLFGFAQLLLSQIPTFHHLWWVSIVGAAMSVGYSMLAGFVAIAAHGDEDFTPDYSARGEGWPMWRGALNSLGAVTFAYGGHSVLLEIQATLKTPPAARKSMMKGVYLANAASAFCYWFVAITGYSAYGNAVDDDVLASRPRASKGWIMLANLMVWFHVLASYQIFSHPIYDAVESALIAKSPQASSRPLVLRVVWRSAYVIMITFAAAVLPFFADLMGLIGAIGFIPMTFIMPNVLWILSQTGRPKYEKALNIGIASLFSILGVLSFIGSLASIIDKWPRYQFWT
eukprot:jgi/Ulvmu1/7244/UM035_0031.1